MPAVPTLVNGRPLETLPTSDRGLQYGDGLFETVAIRDGAACLWEPHMARLERGCRRLRIPFPGRREMRCDVERLLDRQPAGVIKLIVTRGSGGRGYRPFDGSHSTRITSLFGFPDYPAHWWTQGVAARVCNIRLSEQPALAGIKHLNRLEQVLARSEWTDGEVAEGLMLSARNRVIEGTMTNLLAIQGNRLITPDLRATGVRGVMRARIMGLADRLGFGVRERDLSLDDLFEMDELILSNALIGVWAIKSIDRRAVRQSGIASRILEELDRAGDIARIKARAKGGSPIHA